MTSCYSMVDIDYYMNLAERIVICGRKIDTRPFYRIREYFSLLHHVYPHLRGILNRASIASRRTFDIKTLFEKVESIGVVNVVYTIRALQRNVHVRLDMGRVKKEGCTDMIIMNEQGANYFVADRLAWSGLAYSLPGSADSFAYEIKIGAGT